MLICLDSTHPINIYENKSKVPTPSRKPHNLPSWKNTRNNGKTQKNPIGIPNSQQPKNLGILMKPKMFTYANAMRLLGAHPFHSSPLILYYACVTKQGNYEVYKKYEEFRMKESHNLSPPFSIPKVGRDLGSTTYVMLMGRLCK